MISEVSAVQFRQNLGEMLSQVQHGNDSIVIHKDGKPVAALIDSDLFERVRRMRQRFDELTERIAQSHVAMDPAEGMKEIERAVKRARRGK